jgi:hypothetical protein
MITDGFGTQLRSRKPGLILCTASDGSSRKNVVSFHLEAHPARVQVGQFFVMSPVELVE